MQCLDSPLWAFYANLKTNRSDRVTGEGRVAAPPVAGMHLPLDPFDLGVPAGGDSIPPDVPVWRQRTRFSGDGLG